MTQVLLSNVCNLIAGYAFKSQAFGNTYEDKVIKITNITPPKVDMQSLSGVTVTEAERQKLTKYKASSGDFVLAMTGATIGKLGRIVSGEAYVNQRVLLFEPLNMIDKDFLFYVLSHPNFNKFIWNHIDSETAQPNISATSVGQYEFDLPDKKVQRQIAKILSALDSKITLNEQTNNNLEPANDNVAFNLREAA